jgi:uncharacterized membrane protein SirB2
VDYTTVKLIHQSAVTLSLAGFFVRGAASLAGAQWVRGRAARTLPHAVDTALLLSAVTLVVRRHGENMTEGRDLVQLHVVRAVKKALDRKRDRGRPS